MIFPTDILILPNSRLEEILLLSLIFLFPILFFIFLWKLKFLNKRIVVFEKSQKQSDKEIYSLHQKKHLDIEKGRHQERLRISEELHDGIVSKIYGIRMQLEYDKLKDNNCLNTDVVTKELQSIEKETRSITHSLKNHLVISNTSLVVLISDLIKKRAESSGFKYQIKNDSFIEWDCIKESVKINCYRIIQESIQNIIKHSNATFIILEFLKDKNLLNIYIKDNGNGFELSNHKNGIGLENIESRTKRIGGKCIINSSINLGTAIHVSVPI